MILSDHRTLLGSWLQDTAHIQWTASKLDTIINLAIREVEKHILSCDPEAFKCYYYGDATVPATGKDNLYRYPAGTFAVHEIALSSDGVHYGAPLPRRGLGTTRAYLASGVSEACFVPFDVRHFMLFPGQATAVANGIRIIVAPTLGMEDDTDESPLPPAFETLHVLEAKKIALWDVGEPTDSVQREIDKIKTETPRFFLTATEPMFFEPQIDRGY